MTATLFEVEPLPVPDVGADGLWALQYFLENEGKEVGDAVRQQIRELSPEYDSADAMDSFFTPWIWETYVAPHTARGGIVGWCDGGKNGKLHFNAATEPYESLDDGLDDDTDIPLFGFWRDGGGVTVWRSAELCKRIRDWATKGRQRP
jgi:hypothetical protein